MNKKTEYAYDCDVLHADGITWNRYTSLIPAHVNRQSNGEDRELEMYDTYVEAYGEAIKSHMRVEGEIPARVDIRLTRRIVEREETEELAEGEAETVRILVRLIETMASVAASE